MPIVHRYCQGCGALLTLRKVDVTPASKSSTRFKGLYCRNCVQSYRHVPTYIKQCANCHLNFKTTNKHDKYCCIECGGIKPNDIPTG